MCVLTTSSKPRYLWKIAAKESDNEEFGFCVAAKGTQTPAQLHICCTSESPSCCTLKQSLNNVRMIDTILFTHPHRGHRAREKEQGQILRASLCASVGTERESVAPAYLTKSKQIPRSCHPPPSRQELYTVHTHHPFVRKNVT